MADGGKPRVLVLGGMGFVGRHLVTFIVKNQLASKVRVADKVPPATAWLNEEHKAIFAQVDFHQANLSNQATCEKVFADEDGPFDIVYNLAAETKYGLSEESCDIHETKYGQSEEVCLHYIVYNLAAETKYGQSEEVYKQRVLDVMVICAKEAAKTKVKRFIEVSTAQVYDCDKGVSRENSSLSPWTQLAKFKLKGEKELSGIDGLNYVIVRPAIIYGVGDRQGITPRLITGAVYRQLNEKMKLLWTKDLRMNTVHVSDVCRALWHLRAAGDSGQIYNLADKGKTNQGLIADMVSELFEIQHGYFGTVLSNLARVHMASATEQSNEKHLAPWSEACQRDNIINTPLSPYIDQELLYNKHLHIDGSKIEGLGFTYEVPQVTIELLREVVDDYITCGLFPPSLVPPQKK